MNHTLPFESGALHLSFALFILVLPELFPGREIHGDQGSWVRESQPELSKPSPLTCSLACSDFMVPSLTTRYETKKIFCIHIKNWVAVAKKRKDVLSPTSLCCTELQNVCESKAVKKYLDSSHQSPANDGNLSNDVNAAVPHLAHN